MNAPRGNNHERSKSYGPEYSKWEQLWEPKLSIARRILHLLETPLAQVDPVLVVTDVALCCVAGLMLYFDRNAYGVFGSVVIAVLICVMGFVLGRRTRQQHAKNSQTAAHQSPQSGNEPDGSREPR